jgi:hypothetical protein
VSLLTKRVYDMAGCTDRTVKVWLNGAAIACNTFEKYVGMYLPDPVEEKPAKPKEQEGVGAGDESVLTEAGEVGEVGEATAAAAVVVPEAAKPKIAKVHFKLNDRWEVCVAASPDGSFEQTSFVNSICTYKGGVRLEWTCRRRRLTAGAAEPAQAHVTYVADQIAKHIVAQIQKKNKAQAAAVKLTQVKNHMWVFVNCLIVNPAFASQTKEFLSTTSSKVGGSPSPALMWLCIPAVRPEGAAARHSREQAAADHQADGHRGRGAVLGHGQADEGPEEGLGQQAAEDPGHPQAGRRQLRRGPARAGVHAHPHRGRLGQDPRAVGHLGRGQGLVRCVRGCIRPALPDVRARGGW